MSKDLIDRIAEADGRPILILAASVTLLIAVCDYLWSTEISLGILYLLPLLAAAAFLDRAWTVSLAVFAAIAREGFEPNAWSADAPARMVPGILVFLGAALFVNELIQNRRRELLISHQMAEADRARSEAEQEFRALLDGSPAAIVTVDSAARIATVNEAARRLLAFDNGSPAGEPVENYLPVLATIVRAKHIGPMLRTMIETSGRQRTGERFLAHLWVSTYLTPTGPRLAAVVSDATEQLRDREETGLQQLLMNSRIIASAVSHETRNLSAAAGIVHSRLGDRPGVRGSEEYEALGKIIEDLRRLSSAELPKTSEQALEGIDLAALFQQLRLILTPLFEDAGANLEWGIADGLPRVRANHSALLQVFINLAQNGCRALAGTSEGRLRIGAYPLGHSVVIRFADNGPGVAEPERLFSPFQPGASSTGLGLYVSRAIVRTYGGELQYLQSADETCFLVDLPAIPEAEAR